MYILEGNIGAGKSTFINLLGKYLPTIQALPEPKDNWTKTVYGQSLLANFYSNPQRWAYTMETLTMICRAQQHIKLQKKRGKPIIIERSLYSGHYCFALNGYESGFFSKIEWEIYNKWVDFIINKQCQPPEGFIYLKVKPEICMQRIKKRNRISEKDISLEYLKQIDKHHDKFLLEKENVFKNIKKIPVLTLHCNEDFLSNDQVMQKHVFMIKNFIEETQKQKFKQQML